MLHLCLEVADGSLAQGGINWKKRTGFTCRKAMDNCDDAPDAATTTTTSTTTSMPINPRPTVKLPVDDGSAPGVTSPPSQSAADVVGRSPRRATPLGLIGRVSIDTLRPKVTTSPAGIETVQFHVGNPAVEVQRGLLHLYKEKAPLDDDRLPVGRHAVLCVLAVPQDMTIAEFIAFCGPYQSHISHIRLVRDAAPNRYMTILSFVDQANADRFYKEYNNKPFNLLEPLLAHVGFVASMEVVDAVDTPRKDALIELPTCPVCLERMDASVNSITTILCQHSFHSGCIARWGSSPCPVCRYCERPPDENNTCMECDIAHSLWICLICGYVGCGRYNGGHAEQHFRDKGHTFAMEVETLRVWDYVQNIYVHRLIQNKDNGKMVEIPDANTHDERERMHGNIDGAKTDAMNMEFNQILVTQLDSQRHYFELEMVRMNAERDKQMQEMKIALENAEREKRAAEKKARDMFNQLESLKTEAQFNIDLNASMHKDRNIWEGQLKKAGDDLRALQVAHEREVADLQEQLNDVMMSLDIQRKVDASPNKEELQNGSLVIQEAPRGAGAKRNKQQRR